MKTWPWKISKPVQRANRFSRIAKSSGRRTPFIQWNIPMRYPICPSVLWLPFLFVVVVCGCRTADDYSDNPPYYSSPSANGTGTTWNSVQTTQTGSPMWVPVQSGIATNTAPIPTGVVQAGGGSTASVAAPAGVPAGYTAYACVPTQAILSDGRGGYTVGTVQMLQPVGTVGSSQGTGTVATAGGVVQTAYNGTASGTGYSGTVQPLANYPNYGTMQTPGGVAVVAIPSTETTTGTVTTSTVGAYGTATGTGTPLMAPVPEGTHDAANGAGLGIRNGTLTPPSTFIDSQIAPPAQPSSGYSLP